MKNRVFTGKTKTVYVVGDLHGDIESFDKALSIFRNAERDSLLLFLGDYADRGKHGIEIIMALNKLIDDNDNIVALKGNHEIYIDGKPDFSPCHLVDQIKSSYDSWENFYNHVLAGFLAKLYVAALINNVLFVHAGLSSKIKNINDISDSANEKVLLWSDPSRLKGESMDLRGAGVEFGEDITTMVLSGLGLKLLVRSHEPGKAANGPFVEHGGKVITTNSCSSYSKDWKRFVLKINTESLKYTPIYL